MGGASDFVGSNQNTLMNYIGLSRAHTPSWPADGKQLAFLANTSGIDQAWLLAGEQPKQLTFFENRVGVVSWSPTAYQLLVTTDFDGNEHDQLLLVSPAGEVRSLTNQPDVLHTFGTWSVDGRSIYYSSNQRDRAFLDVWVMDIATGAAQCLLALDAMLVPQACSPDGAYLIISRINTEDLDNDLFLVPLQIEGGEPRLLTKHEGHVWYDGPRFAPDGSVLYLLTNYNRECIAPAVLEYRVERRGDEHAPLRLLVETTWDAGGGLALSPDGRHIAWVLNEDGISHLVLFSLETAQQTVRTDIPRGVIEGLTWSPDGNRLAFSLNGIRTGANLWSVDPKADEARQVTHLPQPLEIATLIEPELVRYPSFDELQIPGYFYRPTNTQRITDAGVPVIIFVHGGPVGQFRPLSSALWLPPLHYFLEQGFAIFAPNVRGSSGYGRTYTSLDDLYLRPNSVADVKAAVEWLIAHAGADRKRIGMMGRSYGGFLVLAAISRFPDLWAAAAEMVGIANFVTFLEHTGSWRRRQREAEYGSLERDREFLERRSSN